MSVRYKAAATPADASNPHTAVINLIIQTLMKTHSGGGREKLLNRLVAVSNGNQTVKAATARPPGKAAAGKVALLLRFRFTRHKMAASARQQEQ